MRTELTNNKEALLLGLELAVTIPDNQQDKLDEIIAMCDTIASHMTKKEVNQCKKIIEAKLNKGEL